MSIPTPGLAPGTWREGLSEQQVAILDDLIDLRTAAKLLKLSVRTVSFYSSPAIAKIPSYKFFRARLFSRREIERLAAQRRIAKRRTSRTTLAALRRRLDLPENQIRKYLRLGMLQMKKYTGVGHGIEAASLKKFTAWLAEQKAESDRLEQSLTAKFDTKGGVQ